MNLRPRFFEEKEKVSRILYEDVDASRKISQGLLSLLPSEQIQPVVIVCIGTDRSTGDSLGPLVGTLLHEKISSHFHVYGTLEDPIHAVNLQEKLNEINDKHDNPFIIGVDACLGRLKSVGMVQVGEGPVKPGAGVNKELPEVGEAHITGIVNVSGFMEYMVLQNTRLNLVLKMAKTIANGIYFASSHYHRKRSFSHLNWAYDQEKTP
ncbi:spore protease YyaC [Bacillus sp. M6-12]|uniref:spore protease YyaC n=1 Tax=Bacillus sp. M6-12 TaxID=2054166 RepID=UPI000C768993|nr:spore protease YyaC [Bacillus sp. M6-12]PLS15782.1 spore protease YyaC [Bacillus sp. M6-12]